LDNGYNGFDLIDLAHSLHPNIGSLLLTGYANPEIAEQAEQRGVVVINKPAEVPELLQKLGALFSIKRSQCLAAVKHQGYPGAAEVARPLAAGTGS